MESDEGRSAEFEGKTVEEAIEEGLGALGLTREQVEVEVLQVGSRGFLGLGSGMARVRLVPKEPGPPVAEGEPERPEPVPTEEPIPTEGMVGVGPEDVAVARELLEGLLHHMRIRAEVSPRYVKPDAGQETGTLVLDVTGRDLSPLIGRQGETLRALQYILRLMVNHRLKRWLNVVVDVEGYKRRREVLLQQLAQRMAERVVLNGRPVALEPMAPNERRIVHLALRDHPKVTTQSVGEGDRRRVTILLRKP
ncbi:MAG: RNA-binding cell elongation regulator Jag/EloR [Anaerolineae bacterium]